MRGTPRNDRQPLAGIAPSIKRRGLLAAAWAAVAAFVLRQTTQPVEAGVDGDVVLGASNTTTTQTTITNSAPRGIGLAVLGDAYGIYGESEGTDTFGAGVIGSSLRPNFYGVHGFNPTGVAVFGESNGAGQTTNGIGVLGQTVIGTAAVRGQITSGSSANSIAVYGSNLSTYTGPGPGAGGFGVYGLSAKGHGLVGATATAGGAAVVGATNGVAGAYAAAFYGPVVVSGAFTVLGAKSAAVPHPDGSHRRLYCVESPESWFEDFGEGQLDCGQADVSIDPDFAAMANVESYQVFLTEYDGPHGLCVTNRTRIGFRVRAGQKGASGAFGWRVVAKRKDIPAPRFETVTVPPEPVLPSIPERAVQQPPSIPDLRQRTRQHHR
jgi:hypothetical protein